MADKTNNASSDDSAKSASSGSPWDEDMDIPAEKPEDKQQPKIIGSLDPAEISDEKPVPFNVPEEVIEDKVAKKIPAEQIMGTTKPQYYTPKPVNPAEPRAATSTSTPTKAVPAQSQAPGSATTVPLQQKGNTTPNSQIIPNQSSQTKIPKPLSETEKLQQNQSKSETLKPEIKEHLTQQAPDAISAAPIPTEANAEAGGKDSGGIAELLKSKPVQVPLDEPLTVIPEKSLGQSAVEMDKPKAQTDMAKNDLPLKKTSEEADVKSIDQPLKIDANRPPSSLAINSNKKTMDIQKPAPAIPSISEVKPPASPAVPPPAPITIKEPMAQASAAKPAVSPSAPKTKASPFSKLNPFSKKKQVQPANKVMAAAVNPADVPSAKPPIPTPVARPGLPKGPGKLSWVFALIIIFAASIYLTEIGLLSIGLEKVYGIVGLEKLWGGLPRNIEPAMAEMISTQKENLVFKFRGKITATIDKSKKSPVTSPLVIYGQQPLAMTDQASTTREKAVQTQYDYYGSETGESSDSTDDTSTYDTEGSSATNDYDDSSVGYDDSTGVDYSADSESSNMTDIYETEDQSSVGGYSTDEMTMKQLDFSIEGSSNDDAASSTIDLKPIVGSTKRIEIASSSGSLYVKSNDVKFDEKAVAGKWLGYKFPGLQAKNPFGDLFNMKLDSGLSAKGQRVGNDKLGSGRAYHYKIYSLELGDALGPLGISSSSVETISGDIWIGINDHLLKKIVLEVTPSISASISKLTCELEFYDYGSSNSIVLPAFDNVVTISQPSIAPVEEDEPSPEPVVAPPVDPRARIANDSQRHSDLETIKTALNSYKQSNGRYPVSRGFANLSQADNIVSKAIVPKYLVSMPTDPNSAAGWWYGYKSDGKTFTLSARFENINDAEVTNVDGTYLHYVKN